MTRLLALLRARLMLLAAVFAALLAPFGAPALARPHRAPAAGAHAAAAHAARPALWVVRRGAASLYLFGTIHLMTKDADWFAGPVAQGFNASDTLVTEIIEGNQDEMRQLLMARALLPEGQSLRDGLSPATRAGYDKAMAANGLPAAAFDRFKPWFAALSLVNVPLLHAGFDPASGVDAILAARAQSAGKAHEALETPAFQFGLFDNLPTAAQQRYLAEVVKNLPTLTRDMHQVIGAWRAGRTAQIARLVNTEDDDPELRQSLLVERNRSWASWIDQRLAKPGTTFVAVGAGHLAGRDSVLDRLKAMGISATRLQ